MRGRVHGPAVALGIRFDCDRRPLPAHAFHACSIDPSHRTGASAGELTLGARHGLYEEDSGNESGRIGTARGELRRAPNSNCDGNRVRSFVVVGVRIGPQ